MCTILTEYNLVITRYKKAKKNNVDVLIWLTEVFFFLMPSVDELAELNCGVDPIPCLVGSIVDGSKSPDNFFLFFIFIFLFVMEKRIKRGTLLNTSLHFFSFLL